MDIRRFNKELTVKITTAKRYERNGDIKSAITLWLEISEMTIRLSKNPKLDASFRNMLMNRVKGIFEHIKILKSGRIKEEIIQGEHLTEVIRDESEDFQEQEDNEIIASSSNINNSQEIIEGSDFKNLPKGFKEIKTSEDYEIITPHDKDFVKNQLDKALDNDYLNPKKQEGSEESSKQQDRINFEQRKDSKYKICFACGYDKNLFLDKICRNCGTSLS